MPDTLYDTRFFLALFPHDGEPKQKVTAELRTRRRKFVSAITIHEIYRITLEAEGRELAKIRRTAIQKHFEVVDVDSDIAVESAEIKAAHGRDFPLADSIIAATAKLAGLVCFTDDQHMKSVDSLRTRWF
jgi:predicted nucleic acid-binding protein